MRNRQPMLKGVGPSHGHGVGGVKPDRRTQIEMKIASGEGLASAQAITFAQIGYATFAQRVGNVDPMPQGKPTAAIVMCSDARLPLGDAVLDHDFEVHSGAGNIAANHPTTASRVIVIGHGGYKGCGAVGEAKTAHDAGATPDDPAIAAITTNGIPAEVCRASDPSRENVGHQANQARQQGNADGIFVDVEKKTATLVSGTLDTVTSTVMDGCRHALSATGDMAWQMAGFVAITRAGRRFPGKTVLSADPNQVFEVNFTVRDGRVELPAATEGSAKYALGHVGSVNKSKLVMVVDPDPEVARQVAALARTQLPGATVIAMHEDVAAKRLRPAA